MKHVSGGAHKGPQKVNTQETAGEAGIAQSLSPPAAGVGIKAEPLFLRTRSARLTKMYSSVSDRARGLRVMASLDCPFSVAREDTVYKIISYKTSLLFFRNDQPSEMQIQLEQKNNWRSQWCREYIQISEWHLKLVGSVLFCLIN